jgi:hypothetical protein
MRYKSIKIENFLGGEGQEFFDQPNRFYKSTALALDHEGRHVSIAKALAYTDPTNVLESGIVVQFSDTVFYKLANRQDTGKLAIFSSANGVTAWSRIYDFPDGGGTHYVGCLFIINGSLVAVVNNGYGGVHKTYYSTNGSSWTNTGFSPATGSPTYSVAFADDCVYLVTSGGYVYRTMDGISFSLIHYSKNSRYMDAAFFEGFLYLVLSNGALDKSDLVRLENGEKKFIRSFSAYYPPAIHVLGENMLVAFLNKQKVAEFYFFDSVHFSPLGKATGYSGIDMRYLSILGVIDRTAYIGLTSYESSVFACRYIMAVDISGSFVQVTDLGAGNSCTQVYFSSLYTTGTLQFSCTRTGAGFQNRLFYEDIVYQNYAELRTSTIFLGPHVPVGFVIMYGGQVLKTVGETYPFEKCNIRVTSIFDDFLLFNPVDVADLAYLRQSKYSTDEDWISEGQSFSFFADYRYQRNLADKKFPFTFASAQFLFRLESDLGSSGGENTPRLFSFIYIYSPIDLLNAE